MNPVGMVVLDGKAGVELLEGRTDELADNEDDDDDDVVFDVEEVDEDHSVEDDDVEEVGVGLGVFQELVEDVHTLVLEGLGFPLP